MFGFRRDDSVAAQIRSLARSQLESARRHAANPDLRFAVHETRRRIKRVRGLLRLVAPRFEHFRREDQALGDAARRLSTHRDADALIATLATILADVPGADAAALVAFLARNRPDEDSTRSALAESATDLSVLLDRLNLWEFDGEGFDLLAPGLKRTARSARHALKRASRTGAPHEVHDWRKTMRHHAGQLHLLAPMAPEALGAERELVRQIGDRLGQHQDLHVLEVTLHGHEQAAELLRIARLRRLTLADEALGLGRQSLAEKPAAKVARYRTYWTLAD